MRRLRGGAGLALLAALCLGVLAADDKKPAAGAAKAALTVNVVRPDSAPLPTRVAANGSIAAWQEAIIAAEGAGGRLARVRVAVGDAVKRGELLAELNTDTARAELEQIKATVAETQAALAEAQANAARARQLETSGALSAQQISQFLTAERTAQARLEAQQAAVRLQELRLKQSQITAPDDGVISARNATLGAVVPGGMELFRLIRKGRLEWRAEVAATDLRRIAAGQPVQVQPAGSPALTGTVRMVGPTVDPNTRNGLVYVDLPQPGGAKPGMFARGEFVLGNSAGLTLPQTAVLLRDGFNYVFTVQADSRVRQLKVSVGRRVGERVEITEGLAADARVVRVGASFLADGDTVRVVEAAK